jgi:hypothetical protein
MLERLPASAHEAVADTAPISAVLTWESDPDEIVLDRQNNRQAASAQVLSQADAIENQASAIAHV